jgi:hypothetical protein
MAQPRFQSPIPLPVAASTLLINIGAQIYGLTSTPNMKDINDANLACFTPSSAFVGVFFLSLMVGMGSWLWGVRTARREEERDGGSGKEDMEGYIPFFCGGNLCIAGELLLFLIPSIFMRVVEMVVGTVTDLASYLRYSVDGGVEF